MIMTRKRLVTWLEKRNFDGKKVLSMHTVPAMRPENREVREIRTLYPQL